MPPVRKRSEVWNHYTVINNGKTAKCTYCYQHISYSSGGIGNLKKHLNRKHPSATFNRVSPPPATTTAISNTSVMPEEHPDLSSGNHPESSTLDLLSRSGTSRQNPMEQGNSQSKVQENVSRFITVTRPLPISKTKELDRQLVRMMVKEYQPFRLVEDEEFRKFVYLLNPGYSLPTRKTISNSLIPQLYNLASDEVKEKLSRAEAVCITTDGWTSINYESFIAITAHFCTEESELCSVLLSCVEYYERHTSELLATHLLESVREWGIHNKITAVVTDNAPNMVAAVRRCNWRHVPCFAHSINLIAQAGVKIINHVVVKVKATVEHFKRSPQALNKLNLIQDQMGLPRLKLIQDVPTRWNSTFDMLERFCALKDAIISTTALLGTSGLEQFTSNEWLIMDKAKDALAIFKEVTEEVSTEKNVSLSKVILFITEILTDLRESADNKDLPTDVSRMVEELKTKTSERFKNVEDNDLYAQANILDPRFKKFSFSNEQYYKTACERIKKKVAITVIINVPNETEDSKSVCNEDIATSNSKKRRLYDRFDRNVEKNSTVTNKLAAGIIEFNKYMEEPLLGRKENPLEWWKQREHVYPRLYNLANKRLCIQATSVPCERLFSKAGQIQNEKRSRLKSSKLSKILFLNSNL